MQPVSVPFQIDKNDSQLDLIGYGAEQRKNFFQQVFHHAKNGKIYQLKLVEVNHSTLQRNYLMLCISVAAEHVGMSNTNMRITFENILKCVIDDLENEFYDPEKWYIDIIDPLTGEIKGRTLRPMSDWDTSLMSDFIDLVQFSFIKMYPNFVFPDPATYELPKVGRKNSVPFPDVKTSFKF